MYRPRLIPVLLLKGGILVKSRKFGDYSYIGDPINAVRIFNDLKADELVFLDIQAAAQGRSIPIEFVREVGEEANMPFAVGGGIASLNDIQTFLAAGAERVVLNERAAKDPGFVKAAAETFGSSSIIVCMDVKKHLFSRAGTWVRNGLESTDHDPVAFAQLMEVHGAGELIVQSIDRDGTMEGYDLDLLKEVSDAVSIPVTALGGAGSLEHMRQAYRHCSVNGLAAGSMFVFRGEYRSVLVSYPSRLEARQALDLGAAA